MTVPAPGQHWEYEHHPRRSTVLPVESNRLLLDLFERKIDAKILIADTRPQHRRLFSKLTPPSQPDFAGHYRGEDISYLKNCHAFIPANPMVGCPPRQVNGELYKFNEIAQDAVTRLDQLTAAPNALISEAEKFMRIIQSTAALSAEFLKIHPFANGNGHVGRLLTIALLGRYGHWPPRFKIEPRPTGSAYNLAVAQHQNGNPLPLELFLMNSVKG